VKEFRQRLQTSGDAGRPSPRNTRGQSLPASRLNRDGLDCDNPVGGLSYARTFSRISRIGAGCTTSAAGRAANVETGLLIGVLILGAYVVGGALLWITLSALERWREGR
jgi:hypothetical protein